jgi:hypothetical protein
MAIDGTNGDDPSWRPSPSLKVIVSTYADVSRMSFGWIEQAVPGLVSRANELAPSLSDMELYLGTPDWKSKTRRYNDKNLMAGLEGLASGDLDMLTVSTHAFAMTAFVHSEPIEKRLVSTFEFWIGDAAMPHAAEFQTPLVNLVMEGAAEVDACTAYVNIDCEGDPYRDAIICQGEMYPGFLRYVYGYYWFTVLSASHLDVLTEHGRIIGDAPVFKVHEIDGDRVGLQLAESMLDYSDDQLRALRTFLDPLLRPGPLAGYTPRGRTFETEDRT